MTGGHAKSPQRDELTLLLYGIYGVGQAVFFRVALRLHLHGFFLVRILLAFGGWLTVRFRNGLEDSLRVASEDHIVVVVGVGSIVWIEGGQFSEDELIGAGLGGRTCSRTSCGGKSNVP